VLVRNARRSRGRTQEMCVGNVESLLAFLNLTSTSPLKISSSDDRARYRALPRSDVAARRPHVNVHTQMLDCACNG
jgi:hypothetical protein